MTRVERLLQIHMAVLAALGTLLLGMGQRDAILPTLMVFSAATSLYFTDTVRWFVLNRTLGNIAAVAAVGIATFHFLYNPSEQQLLSIANLLVYLQIVLLYQQKSERRYWELMVLSLLQVVVAAALNLGFEFGVLLALYMLTAFSALALFFVYRESLHYCAPERPAQTPPVPIIDNKQRSVRRRLLGESVVALPAMPAQAFARGMLGWSFLRHVSAMGLTTMVFTVVLFYSVPRTGNAVWQGLSERQSQVDFVEEVTLDERGEIRQSGQVVMRTSFRMSDSREPVEIAGEPYFAGTVLTDYFSDEVLSRWSSANAGRIRRGRPLPEPPDHARYMIQETVLLAPDDRILFGTPPPLRIEGTPDEVRYDAQAGQLFRRRDYASSPGRTYAYQVGSGSFREGWQLPVIPYGTPDIRPENMPAAEWALQQLQLEEEKERLTAIDPGRYPQLVATATRIVGRASLAPEDRDVAARLLQDHFRSPGTYAYTLDFSRVPRTPGVDPIEDFVANHRTGHCEYFASALCLMLRSQGIPARIVVGYKGGDFNSVGGYYLVRKLHAHAWVEAYLEPHQVPPGVVAPEFDSPLGAWLRLDPTPAFDGADHVSVGVTLLARLGDIMDYTQLLWDDYVLGLNSERQKKNIYSPLAEQASSAIAGFLDVKSWPGLERIARQLGIDDMAGHWFNWRAGLAAIIVSSVLVLLYQLLAWLGRWLGVWWRGGSPLATRQRRVVAFYDRLEELLGQLKIERRPEQTQREFAATASQSLAALGPHVDGVSDLPRQVVDAFYLVRFGDAALSDEQTLAIENALARLARFVENPLPPVT